MLIWRSVRGRALLAGALLTLLLATVGLAAVWRANDDRHQHDLLERRSEVVASMENARAQAFRGATMVTAAVFAEDATPYVQAARQEDEQRIDELDRARTGLIALGDADGVAAIDGFLEQLDQTSQAVDAIVDSAATADIATRIAVAQQYYPQLWAEAEAQLAGLDRQAGRQQEMLAAERAAADRSADITLWLLVGSATAAFLAAAAAVAMLALSVVRPLSLLRARVRTIASGNLDASAEVSGPEELASLARDFNDMVAERKRAEAALRHKTHDLGERVKELNCLYRLSNLLQEPRATLEAALGGAVQLIPPSWQYPDVACARITVEGQEFRSVSFDRTTWGLAAPISVGGNRVGSVEVYYRERRPDADEGPFLKEERSLIEAIAERLGEFTERRRAADALRESEERYRSLVEASPDAITLTDLDTSVIMCNEQAARLQGFESVEDLLSSARNALDFIAPEDRQRAIENARKTLESGTARNIEYTLLRKDGTRFAGELSASVVTDTDGRPHAFTAVTRDITERRRMEEALRESEERARLIVETANDALVSMDPDGLITGWNVQAEATFGWPRSLALGRRMADTIIPPDHREAHERGLKHFLKTGEGPVLNQRIEMTALHRDGHQFPVELAIWPVRSGATVTLNAFVRDITERKLLEETLREQVRRDPLTGVLNHGAIVGELRRLISGRSDGALHAVAMADVDGLKATNDAYGHQVGDAVLLAVAGTLSRDGALVGRYGGDEFLALLPGADRTAAECYRDAVLSALADTGLTDPETGAQVGIAASLGLVVYPTEADEIEELVKLADDEMYAAKRQRPVASARGRVAHRLGSQRAAKLVGEIAPLLTSPSDLGEKLRLVAHRLSVGAGYDGVNFRVYGHPSEPPTTQAAYSGASEEAIEMWNREHRRAADHPLRQTLERLQRPIIIDDVRTDQRLTAGERELLGSAGLRSALVAPMIWRGELIGSLSVASKRGAAFTPLDGDFTMVVAAQVTAMVRMATLVDDLQSASTGLAEARVETVMLLAAAAEAHDRTTGSHLRNVRCLAEALACDLGQSEEDASELGVAAVLHDIGKIRVPDVVLASTGRLTREEWELMKHHTTWGYEFLIGRPDFDLAATIARSHHERWDGTGYPDGLAGDAIPEAAAIVAVADSFDAITSDRPYRPARSVAAAAREISACSSEQFSPRVVEALMHLRRQGMLPALRTNDGQEDAAA